MINERTSNDEILTTKEAAKYLKVSPGTLAVWRCENTYPDLIYYRLGNRKIVYKKSDLDAWLNSHVGRWS